MAKALSQWSAMNLSFYLDIGSRSLHTPYSQALLCEGMAQMELGKKNIVWTRLFIDVCYDLDL